MPKRTSTEPNEKTDSPLEIERKTKELIALIKASSHVVLHAGAGISTSANIPDFRGPKGVWTMQEKGEEPDLGTEFEEAIPTLSHMAIVELMRKGIIKYVVSQNVDGLFLRSGIPEDKLSELHGNIYLETCSRCKHRYLRDYDAAIDGNDSHFTGRYCDQLNCNGKLKDSIINFGEQLPKLDVERAEEHSKKADLSIVIGSSLTVTPACDFPMLTLDNNFFDNTNNNKKQPKQKKKKRNTIDKVEEEVNTKEEEEAIIMEKKHEGKLAILNLMQTPLDKHASVRIFGKSDDIMRDVMKQLGLSIPPFQWYLKVWLGNSCKIVTKKKQSFFEWTLYIAGESGFQSNFMKKAELLLPKDEKNDEQPTFITMEGEGEGIFQLTHQTPIDNVSEDTKYDISVRIHFIDRLAIEPKEFKHYLQMTTHNDKQAKNKEDDLQLVVQDHVTLHMRDVHYS